MSALYVIEPGARVEREGQHFIVTKNEEVLSRIPAAMVDEIVLVGWTHITTPAMLSLLNKGKGLTMISPTGKLRGRLVSPGNTHPMLHYQQYKRGDNPAFSLSISRNFVYGKIYNTRTMMRRMLRKDGDNENEVKWRGLTDDIESILKQVRTCNDLSTLRGLEGIAAKKYFQVFKHDLQQHGFSFPKRQRRPPKDPVNSLLSLGYSFLTNSIISACEIAGLDPYAGFLHAEKYNRPALALDLMEEFRVPIVDATVLLCLNKRIIDEDDFYLNSEGGMRLKSPAFRKFIKQYIRRISTRTKHPSRNHSNRYQTIFELQAREIRKAIEDPTQPYEPFLFH